MKEQVKEISNTIGKIECLKKELNEKRELFNEQNKQLIEDIKASEEMLNTQKDIVKQIALEEFIATGNKKLYGGIGIRVTQSLEYDTDKAFQWAKEHSLCLKLDESAFKKIAKTQPIEFVTTMEVPTVTFPAVIKLEEE